MSLGSTQRNLSWPALLILTLPAFIRSDMKRQEEKVAEKKQAREQRERAKRELERKEAELA